MASSNIQTFDQSLKSYSGRNAFSENTNLDPTQFRTITNLDLFQGNDGDYVRSRRGSTRLVPEVDPIKQLGTILNKVVFPVNGEEYLICAYVPDPDHPSIKFSSQALLTIGNPVEIKSNSFVIESSTFLSKLVLYGVNLTNSDNLTLYYHWNSGGTSLDIYKDSDHDFLVASVPVMSSDITNIVEEEISSGITGTIYSGTLDVSDEDGTIHYDALELDSSYGTPDLKVYNNRVYVFHQSGNRIIEWNPDQSVMHIRDMGLVAPIILTWGSGGGYPTGMDEQGIYYYGVEKVTQKDGADLVGSTPRRKFADGSIPPMASTAGNIYVQLEANTIVDDLNWTHIRLWRSKNTVPNFSDPLFPIDAQGEIDQLYEVALITRAEMYSPLASIATGVSLPPGNAGVQAGNVGGNYYIADANTDAVLFDVVGIDLIELVPLPGCRTGDINNGRVFSSGIGSPFLAPNGEMNSPVIAEDILYTTNAFSEYQEQWDAQAFIDAGRDGKKTTCIIILVQDIIIIREGQTKRIQAGNPDAGITMVDAKIGIPTFRMAGYIPSLGICAICSDKYFRYLDFDLAWHQTIGSVEVSQSVYDLTSDSFSTGIADFVYINGKLLMMLPSSTISALHMKNSKGWTLYTFPNNFESLFLFSNNQRAASATDTQYTLEIESSATDDDDASSTVLSYLPIAWSFETYGFSGKGLLLEPTRYSFWGLLTSLAQVSANVSGSQWLMQPTFQQPGLYAANSALNEREYRFEPQPQTVGLFGWVPLRGQFISFSVSGTGTAMVSWQKLVGRIRQTFGNQQATLAGGIIPQGPGWNNKSLMLLNFEDPGDTFFDASGKQVNYYWVPNHSSAIVGDYAPHVSNLVLSTGTTVSLYGSFVGGVTHEWRLWNNAADRDANNLATSLGVFPNMDFAGSLTFTTENASGVTGTVDNDGDNSGSGNLDYIYSVGTKTNRVPQKPGFGVTINSPGYIHYPDDPASPLIGVKNLTWKAVFSFPTDGSFTAYGKNGSSSWLLTMDAGRLVFVISAGFTWTASISPSPDTVYALIFVLKKDLSGQFYLSPLNGAFSGKVPTTKTNTGSVDVPSGPTVAPAGTASYYEVEISDYREEQAKRFWGMMKAYPSGTVGP